MATVPEATVPEATVQPGDVLRYNRVAVWLHGSVIIALPLTGLLAISGGADSALTDLVGGLAFPVIPGVSEATGKLAGGVYEVLVFTTLGLLVLHIGTALKHQFVQRYRAAERMPPFREPKGASIEQTSD